MNIIKIAEKLYKEANPNSKFTQPPSIVYEAIESRYKKWLELTSEQKKLYPFEHYARILSCRNNLTKEQAQQCLNWGYKISHKRFSKNEFIVKKKNTNSQYIDEEGTTINIKTFWNIREKSLWNKNWYII